MSSVTSLLLSLGHWDEEENQIACINTFFDERGVPGLVSIDAPSLPTLWYGGTRYFEAYLYIGAFNYMTLSAFIDHLKTLEWKEPETLQLIVLDYEDALFKIINVFEGESP